MGRLELRRCRTNRHLLQGSTFLCLLHNARRIHIRGGTGRRCTPRRVGNTPQGSRTGCPGIRPRPPRFPQRRSGRWRHPSPHHRRPRRRLPHRQLNHHCNPTLPSPKSSIIPTQTKAMISFSRQYFSSLLLRFSSCRGAVMESASVTSLLDKPHFTPHDLFTQPEVHPSLEKWGTEPDEARN